MRKRIAPFITLLLLAGGVLWYYYGQPIAEGTSIAASGTIEAEEVSITAEIGGRIKSIRADEGDEVKAGDTLLELDEALLVAQMKEAEAAVGIAKANLALVKAGTPQEEIRQAKAALSQARATREGAKRAWEDASAIRENPQELNAKIDAAAQQLVIAQAALAKLKSAPRQEELTVAEAKLRIAEAQLGKLLDGPTAQQIKMAEIGVARAKNNLYYQQATRDFNKGPGFRTIDEYMGEAGIGIAYEDLNLALAKLEELKQPPLQRDVAQAEASVEMARAQLALVKSPATAEDFSQAEATVTQAQKNLDNLIDIRERPLVLNTQVDAAKAQYEAALAAEEAAQGKLDALLRGATKEQIEVSQAQVHQAEAALARLRVQLDKATLKSPLDGWVTARTAHVGEVANPGMALMTVANIDKLKLRVYIPEDKIGNVVLGQAVDVTVDSFPGKVYKGEVVYISPRVEFTPREVQTKKERASTVFAAKVQIVNTGHELKPGMPADAKIKM